MAACDEGHERRKVTEGMKETDTASAGEVIQLWCTCILLHHEEFRPKYCRDSDRECLAK